MLVYLDESYDNAHSFFLLGAIFIPDSIPLHRAFRRVKVEEGYVLPSGEVKEVKYSQLLTPRQLRIAKAGVDLFLGSDAWFRCIVVDQRTESGWSLDDFGRPEESNAIKKARFYNQLTEMLLRNGIQGVSNGVLMADRMTRCAGDDFLRRISDEFSSPSGPSSSEPSIRAVVEVDTALEVYHLGQIGDLLTGAILNDLVEPKSAKSRYKREFKTYVKDCIGVPSLGPDYWDVPENKAEELHPRFQARQWNPKQ